MKKKYSHGELAKMILLGLVGVGLVIVCVTLPGIGPVFELFKPKNTYERRKLRHSFKTLQKQNMVHVYNKNGKTVIKITEKGQKKVLKYNLENMEIRRPKKWDGKYRIIMFDVPETKKIARRELSSVLARIGAYRIQKSAFVSPFECRPEIDFVGGYYGVRTNIIYITAEDLDNADAIKKRFHLP